MSERPVVLGRKVLVGGVAHHWAVKAGPSWYEIEGADKNANNAPNDIKKSTGDCAKSGACPQLGGLIGTTRKTDDEIEDFKEGWLRDNPRYHITTTNCQKFAKDLADFLCDDNARLPKMEAGIRGRGSGPASHSAAANGTAIAEASVGRTETQHGVAWAAAEGPNASAKAVDGEEGWGAFAKAAAWRAEAGLGPVGVHVEPNVNTGFGVHDGKLEVAVVGWGFKAGSTVGFELDTPMGGARCSIM